MYQKLIVLDQKEVIQGVKSLVIEAGDMAKQSQPGQFLMLKAWEDNTPFLMRPISINSVDLNKESITLLYKVVGKGTGIMAKLKAGDEITALGPLGHGFPIPERAKRVAVIGRGIGIAPLRFLVESCISKGIEVYAYLSAKRKEEVFHADYFASIGAKVKTCTDASINVTGYFQRDLEQLKFDAAYSCGSKRLAGDMKRFHDQYGFEAYVSLEEHMACGVGACKGCVCETLPDEARPSENQGPEYALVCKHGPVFAVEKVIK